MSYPSIEDLYVKRRVNSGLGALLGKGWHDDYRPASRLDIRHALGDVAACENCGGSGTRTKYVQAGALEWPEQWPCPSCDGGLVVSPEAVERAAIAIYALDWGNHPAHMNAAVFAKAKKQAASGLRAALGLNEGET